MDRHVVPPTSLQVVITAAMTAQIIDIGMPIAVLGYVLRTQRPQAEKCLRRLLAQTQKRKSRDRLSSDSATQNKAQQVQKELQDLATGVERRRAAIHGALSRSLGRQGISLGQGEQVQDTDATEAGEQSVRQDHIHLTARAIASRVKRIEEL